MLSPRNTRLLDSFSFERVTCLSCSAYHSSIVLVPRSSHRGYGNFFNDALDDPSPGALRSTTSKPVRHTAAPAAPGCIARIQLAGDHQSCLLAYLLPISLPNALSIYIDTVPFRALCWCRGGNSFFSVPFEMVVVGTPFWEEEKKIKIKIKLLIKPASPLIL